MVLIQELLEEGVNLFVIKWKGSVSHHCFDFEKGLPDGMGQIVRIPIS